MRNRFFLLFTLILLLTSVGYRPLEGKSFDKIERSVEVENQVIELELNIPVRQSNSKMWKWVLDDFASTSEKVVQFAASQNLPKENCRPVSKLEIYITNMSTLNDRKRFGDWKNANSSINIWAIFDQKLYDKKSAVIVLTDHKKYNNLLLAHELAHYWHYKMCWEERIDSEEFARRFELYYLEL